MVGYRSPRFVSRSAMMSLALSLALGCQDVEVADDNEKTLFLFVTDGTTEIPLEGVELCEYDTENCTETDADGLATLDLPSGQDVMWSLVKAEYASVLEADRTDAAFDPQRTRNLFSDEAVAESCRELKELDGACEWPLGGDGGLWILTEPDMAGVTFELVGVTKDPYYSWYDEETGWHSDWLTQTTDVGVGGFVNVPPGDYALRMGGTARACAPASAWAAEEPNEVTVPIRADHITYAWINCTPI